MNTKDTEAPSEEGRSEEEPCSPEHQPTLSPNQWERIARRCLPQVTTKGGYMLLAKSIEAMRANGIVDRFSSTAEMARFLTEVLGWEVKYRTLNRAIVRLNGKSSEWEKGDEFQKITNVIAGEKQRHYEEENTRNEIKNLIIRKQNEGLNRLEILAELGKLYLEEHECGQMWSTFDF